MVDLLITGGMGFIGSNFVRHMLQNTDCTVTVLDKLTYAGNPANLEDIAKDEGLSGRYRFVKGDICDAEVVESCIKGKDGVINFAAETHVDRSIMSADSFIRTDILGTYTLLDLAKKYEVPRFIQISTDEVYGSIEPGRSSVETDPISPNNPYSASKAGADILVLSYFKTYKTPVLITRSSNNYGPYQYPEKMMPLFITNLLEDKKVPLYGDGMNIRDWLHVEDNCRGIQTVFEKGEPGEIYNIGGSCEKTNKEVTGSILSLLGKDDSMIEHVADRLGHDRRYSLDSSKIMELEWSPKKDFNEGLKETVEWYTDGRDWWVPIKSGEFEAYYKEQYEDR